MHQIIDALQHLKKSKTSWENVLDGITPYQNSILLVCYFIKQCLIKQISNFKNSFEGLLLFMIPSTIFSSNLLTIFLKAIAMHNKKDCEKKHKNKGKPQHQQTKQAINTKNTFLFTTSWFP